MSTDTHDQAAVEDRLWDEIDKARVGMVGIVDGDPQHFQPMTTFTERGDGEIWFFTRADTDLSRDASRGARQVMFTVQARDGDFQACIGGEMTVEMDRAKIEKWWSPMVAAWYPEGKDDHDLRLLRVKCHEARVWISDAGPVKYLWEVAKANATHTTPDLGGRTDVNFH